MGYPLQKINSVVYEKTELREAGDAESLNISVVNTGAAIFINLGESGLSAD
jgi:hypothetical protein